MRYILGSLRRALEVDSSKLGHGCRMIYAVLYSAFVGLELEDGRVPTFWLLLQTRAVPSQDVAMLIKKHKHSIHCQPRHAPKVMLPKPHAENIEAKKCQYHLEACLRHCDATALLGTCSKWPCSKWPQSNAWRGRGVTR